MTARKRLDEMKQFIKIAEGAWDLPRGKEDFDKIAAILRSDEPNIKIHDMLYNVLGDDDLFDRLEALDPYGHEAPGVIAQWMKDQRRDPHSNFPNIWKTFQLSQREDSPMNEEEPDFGPAAQGKSDIVKKWGAEQSKEVTDLSLSELEEDPEDFKNTLANPQWDERRAAEKQKRKDWLRRTYQAGDLIPDDLHMARVKTPKGTGTVYSIHNYDPSEASGVPTVSVRLDDDPGGYGGGKLQYIFKLSDVEILPDELDEVGDVKFDDYGAVDEDQKFRVRPNDPWMPDTPVPDKFKRNGVVMKQRKGYQAWLQAEKDKVDQDVFENIELNDVVESILQEYPGQSKNDYDDLETDQAEFDAAIAAGAGIDDFLGEIDPEISDDELGFRFD